MVINPFRNRVQFVLESILLSGTLGRLFVAALLIAGVAFLTGLLGFLAALGTDQAFANPLEAVWWAFLRLTDPGYLGDDEGVRLRTVSTLVTIAGYVLFMGLLIAILTQGLNEKIRKLETGLTPISAKKHIILLGWNNRTPLMVQRFLLSEGRVKRFLRRVGARRLKLVLLVDEVHASHTGELRNFMGPEWDPGHVVLRSGSPLRLDHLMRVDYLRAGAILLPALDRGGAEAVTRSDDAAIKTILSIAQSLRLSKRELPPPLLVAELFDARKIPTALKSYQGPVEVVASDEVVSRMLAQMTRHPRISEVFRELLTVGHGNEIFVRDIAEACVGTGFWELARANASALLIGVVRKSSGSVTPILNPWPDYRFKGEDKVVFLAANWADLDFEGTPPDSGADEPWPAADLRAGGGGIEEQNVLILGWSRRLPALIEEYEGYANRKFSLTIASRTPIGLREQQIEDYGAVRRRTTVKHRLSDHTVPESLRALGPELYDSIVCVSSDRIDTDEDADARTLVAYSILKSMFGETAEKPRILLELLDELNVGLVDPADCEYLLSSQVLSHMLVEVTLRHELNAVFQELFNSSDTEIYFQDYERYGFSRGARADFSALQRLARAHGEVALGVFKREHAGEMSGGTTLNPPRNRTVEFAEGDKLVVLRQ